MARAKKTETTEITSTTPNAETPNAETENVLTDEINVIKPQIVPLESTKTKAKKHYSEDDEIECKSICTGKTNFLGKSGLLYVFLGYGDTEKVKYKDLKAANAAKSAYLYKPMIIVQNKEIADELKLTGIYAQFLNFESPQDFFNLPLDKMRKLLLVMPDGMKETIKNTATTLIQENALDSVVKIKLLDEVLGTEFISFM